MQDVQPPSGSGATPAGDANDEHAHAHGRDADATPAEGPEHESVAALRREIETLKARVLERTAELESLKALLAASNRDLAHFQRASRRSDERLALALSAAGLAWWDCDFTTGIVYLSEEWSAMLGGERKAVRITLTELADLVHPDDCATLERESLAVMKGEKPSYRVEHRVRDLRGGWRWIDSRGEVTQRDAKGRATRGTGTNIDITARVQAEHALRQNEALLSAFTDEIPMLVTVIDRDERYRFVNRMFETWFGMKCEDVIGRRVIDVIGDAEYERVRTGIAEAMSGTPVSFRRRSVIGREIFARYFPHRDEAGNIVGVYTLAEDVSPKEPG